MTSQKTATSIREIHKLIGAEIEVDPPDSIAVSWQVGSTSYDAKGYTKTYNWVLNRRFCRSEGLLDVSGFATTGDDGTVTFPLTDAACRPVKAATVFNGYVSVVATPRGRAPRFVTTQHRRVDFPDDVSPGFSNEVEITISAFDPNGDPAPRTSVHWRCLAGVTANEIT